MSVVVLAACFVTAGFVGLVPAGSAAASVVRVLVVKETWGPTPFTATDIDGVMQSVASFYAAASFGQLTLDYDQTPWLQTLAGPPPACNDAASVDALPAQLAALATNAGYSQAGYDQVVIVFPSAQCLFSGGFEPDGIVLDGRFDEGLVAHELGHSFGMGHAGLISCRYLPARFCRADVYGDPWDVMGGGQEVGLPAGTVGDPGALQKARAGWLTDYAPVTRAGSYRLAPLEQSPSGIPQALVIRTAGFEYWVDRREALGNDSYLASDLYGVTSGFEVHRAPANVLAARADFPVTADYLVPRGKKNLYFTPTGTTLTVPGLFALTDVSRTGSVMTIRFRWLDHTRPSAPLISAQSATVSDSGHATLRWTASRDTGSGVASYLPRK